MSITNIIWPQAPADTDYVEQSFGTNDYISTGYFEKSVIGSGGVGRSFENVQGVTSLFFDVDLVGLINAQRVADGETLEAKVSEKKKFLYAMDDDEVAMSKELLLENTLAAIVHVMKGPPHAVVDSGWGYHFHYAIAEDYRAEKDALKELHIAVVTEANRIVYGAVDGLEWPKAFDATNDVGCRLARVVGSWNKKDAKRPMPVKVISGDADEPLVDAKRCAHILRCIPAPSSSTHRASASASSRSSTAGTVHHIYFDKEPWPPGGTFQDMIDCMSPGETLNVVCPFGGSSKRSGFFVREVDGRSRYVSNATKDRYINKYRGPVQPPQPPTPPGGSPPPPPGGSPPSPPAPPSGPTGGRVRATLRMRVDRNGNGTGRPEPTTTNLMAVLRDDSTFDLKWDEFRQMLMDGDREVADSLYIQVLLLLEQDYNWNTNQPSKDKIWATAESVGRMNAFNPVTDYLNDLTWDGVSRVEYWIDRAIMQPCVAAGAELDASKTSLYRAYSKRWAISLVARALMPGCKVDTVLTLSGRQGFRKSTLFEAWSPFEDLFVDTKLNMSNSDKYLTIHRSWIYEDAEMASGSRASQEVMKNFLSSREDTFRSPYGRVMKSVKRKCVVVGTTNDASILKDTTGSRRYWIVDIPELCLVNRFHASQPVADIDYIRANRDQLLAEAVALFKSGEDYWLSPQEDEQRDAANQKHTTKNPWEEYADIAFFHSAGGKVNAFSVSEFVQAIDSEMSPNQISRISLTLTGALNAAGFRKHSGKIRGRVAYIKPVPSGVTPLKENGLQHVKDAVFGRSEDPFRDTSRR